MTESLAPVGPPFPCPGCGATDQWRADYYQAVSQGATVVLGADGEPDLITYSGDEDSYDDGSTENEGIACGGCGHAIVFGRHVFVRPFDLEALKAECGYTDEPPEDADGLMEDMPVDALIGYKDALEGVIGSIIPAELWLAPQTEGDPQ